jgi:putative transposase
MANHIHLQMQTINHHHKDLMKLINSRNAMHFNMRLHLVGQLFQGRYGVEIIDTAEYSVDLFI